MYCMFVFSPGDYPFESEPSLTSADACGEVTVTKSLAWVAPEVDLRNVHYIHLHKKRIRYPWFGFLVTSPMGFKARVGSA